MTKGRKIKWIVFGKIVEAEYLGRTARGQIRVLTDQGVFKPSAGTLAPQ